MFAKNDFGDFKVCVLSIVLYVKYFHFYMKHVFLCNLFGIKKHGSSIEVKQN